MRAKATVISDIGFVGIIPVIRTDKPEQIIPLCEAVVAGGITILELTMTIPNPVETLKKVVAHFGQKALIGMGSLLNGAMARAAADAGAEFLVTPITKLEVVAVGRTANRPVMLGAYTPTEAALAMEAGADFIKIFPADNLGPNYLKALRAPMPQLKLVPTGGVTLENAADFLKAGAAALGIGGSLVTSQILKESNWAELTRLSSAYVRVVQEARKK
ncbi:MAG: bifunctional 4-hydroxy-2-oxoglutarate aldolase/2-dehydro-3-deoxy-phosphogluconate aldolase [Verrucomicrobiota bacterium]